MFIGQSAFHHALAEFALRGRRLRTGASVLRTMRGELVGVFGKCLMGRSGFVTRRRYSAAQWGFVDGRPIQNHFREMSDLPASTPLSDTISKDLKKRGFTFVGSTIVYAHMQATGMVNDHLTSCFRHAECEAMAG